MHPPDRFRDPIALALSLVSGIACGLFALNWPLPWLAAVVGPVFLVIVLLISARPNPTRDGKDDSPEPEPNVAGTIRGWAEKVTNDNPARAHADQAVTLVGDIENLNADCRRRLKAIKDGSIREAKEMSLDDIKNHFTGSLNMHRDTNSNTGRAPAQPVEWFTLVRRLESVKAWLQAERDVP